MFTTIKIHITLYGVHVNKQPEFLANDLPELRETGFQNATYLLGGPLEASNNTVLDFIEVLDSLGAIDDEVSTSSVGTEAPDLTGFCYIKFIGISQVTGSLL